MQADPETRGIVRGIRARGRALLDARCDPVDEHREGGEADVGAFGSFRVGVGGQVGRVPRSTEEEPVLLGVLVRERQVGRAHGAQARLG